jgi:hypothetical protein
METPVRIYQYAVDPIRRITTDILAAGLTTATILLLAQRDAVLLGVVPLLVGSAWSIALAYQNHLKLRARIWLFTDRVAWTGWFGRRHEVPLDRIAKALPLPVWLTLARGTARYTPNGILWFTADLEGYGDLSRRLDGSPFGWADRPLPPSRLTWPGQKIYRYEGTLPLYILSKATVGFAVLFMLMEADSAWAMLLPIMASLFFLAWAYVDARQMKFARIELKEDRLVQYDRWGRVVAAVHFSALHHLTTHESWAGASGRIDGDDGTITFDRNLKNPISLIQAVATVVAERHRQARHLDRSHREPEAIAEQSSTA